jgi:ankyrin repeat protein
MEYNNEKDVALFKAVANGNTELVKELLEKGAEVNSQNDWGQTPISAAAARDDQELFQLLYEKGADPNITDSDGWTAYQYVAENGDWLVEEYQDLITEVDLRKAEKNGKIELVKELLEAREARENAKYGYSDELEPNYGKNEDGKTALHLAAAEGKVEVVNTLLAAGADKDIQDKKGNTPLHEAAENGHYGVVKLLVAGGADIRATNEDFNTAQQVADNKGQFLVGNFLMEESHAQNPGISMDMSR